MAVGALGEDWYAISELREDHCIGKLAAPAASHPVAGSAKLSPAVSQCCYDVLVACRRLLELVRAGMDQPAGRCRGLGVAPGGAGDWQAGDVVGLAESRHFGRWWCGDVPFEALWFVAS